MLSSIAIIIPAYKKAYFDKALQSLADQTVKKFTVYIGDDCSPEDLVSIVDRYRDKICIVYHRFDKNLGSVNIVEQWERCINLSKQEQWIWLFSDDDVADSKCIEDFHRISALKQFDVYRFNTSVIDANDKIIYDHVGSPEVESSAEMAYWLLKGKRGNSMPDHIFSRHIYNKHKLVNTAYAQAADWATSIQFSKEKGMCTIPNSRLFWRYSGNNISSIASSKRSKMVHGHIQFIEWTKKHFEYLKTDYIDISYGMMMDALRSNLTHILITHYKGFSTANIKELYNCYHKTLELSSRRSLKELLIVLISTQSSVHYLYKKFKNFASNHKTALKVL
jgi:glycosyltransferase involved in cell wall biosynthesis